MDYFDHIYKRVGSKFDRLYFESEVFESGKKIVEEFLSKGVFVKSEGAIIFPGEKYGLHNRVFITGEGNPTYEGKDIGLAKLQFEQYHPDLIIHVVGPEQSAYFQVLFKALELVFPHIQGKEKHLIYGWVKLKEGKMSSRSGNVVLGEWLIDEAEKEVCNILLNSKSNYTKEYQNEITEKAAIAAVKYSFLRVSTRQEISFDLKTSVSFDGDSGPYLQYTYARCKSVLRKAKRPTESDLTPVRDENVQKLPSMQKELLNLDPNYLYNPEEREIARLITLFPYVVIQAATEYTPNVVCTYLFNLAQAYNVFYAQHSILGTDNKKTYSSGSADEVIQSEAKNSTSAIKTTKFRLALTAATAQVLKNGLYLLGIETLEQM